MRDIIIGMCIATALIAVFSMFGYAPIELEQKSGNFVMAVESGEPTPQPTEGTEPFVPVPTEETEPPTEPPVTEQPVAEPTKTIDEVAWEVIVGLWACTEERERLLTEAGYDYEAVQQRVNEILERSDYDGN